jgi:arabinofuranosyltransferase
MKSNIKKPLHFFAILAIVSVFTFAYWKLYQEPALGIDDANIYFVYAQNAAEGNGFVFNAGEERVEGFTSFLWTIIATGLYAFSEHFGTIMLILNIFIISYTLYRAIRLINLLIPNRYFLSPAAILFLALILLIPGYVEWTILSLMETGLWSLLIVLLAIQLTEYIITEKLSLVSFNIALFLLIFTRPESILWGLFFALSLGVINLLKGKTSLRQHKSTISAFLVYGFSIALLTGFRLAYFHYPLPNTYYAKVSGNLIHNLQNGLAYFLKSCVQTPTLWLILLLSLLSLVFIGWKIAKYGFQNFTNSDIVQTFIASIAMISLAIPVALGGDHFNFARFYQPFFPVYYLLFFNLPFYSRKSRAFFTVRKRKHQLFLYLLVFLLLPYIYLNTRTHLLSFKKSDSPLKIEFEIADLGRENGEKLNTLFRRVELPSVGISEAGGFAYAYHGRSLDLLGLNSTLVAHADDKNLKGVKNHSAFSKKAFYELQPDVFYAHSSTSYFVDTKEEAPQKEDETPFAVQIYGNIFAEPEFNELYEKILIHDPQSQMNFLTICHKNFIKKLTQHQYEIIYLENYQIPDRAPEAAISAAKN